MSENKPHGLILDNRSRLSLTGALDVAGFNEECVTVTTSLGDLVIRGSSLHISKLNLDTGEVDLEGNIAQLQYTGARRDKGFFKRLLS